MKCVFCDAELNENELTCPKCGKDVQIVPDYNEFDEDYLNDLIGTLSEEERKERAKEKAKERKKKEAILQKKKKSLIKKIVIGASILLVIIIIALVIIGVKRSIDAKNYNSLAYQLNKAQESYSEGNLEEAISFYDRALVLDENNVDIMLSLADIYSKLNDNNAEMAFLKQVRTIEPYNELAIKKLIEIYDKDEDYESILAIYYTVMDNPGMEGIFDKYITPDPIFSVSSGDYSEPISVSIHSEKNYVIYFTTDGQNPKEFGSPYAEELEFSEEGEYEIQAVCVNELGLYSNVISQKYNIIYEKPAMPIVSPDGGTFTSGTKITIDVPEGCSAYYLWGGSNPSSSSTKYKKPFGVIEGNNVLSVIIINDTTEKCSEIYKGRFEYYKE